MYVYFDDTNLTDADLTFADLSGSAFDCESLKTTTLDINAHEIYTYENINGFNVEVSSCK
jgi:uncharacterized protein YjbI with pentapeptide repeats